ncbi:type 2 phosphatidylinositol 4,5-bisphosphate 4-phosphatase-like [Sycon ciliatum]|uniref:type 2 phosphatidylinositol 4,5-bisphosphate 4-phosphatase-like n=1 Tax=Sycon ciliatum TaxID=27933 RepID=UPI0020AE3FB2
MMREEEETSPLLAGGRATPRTRSRNSSFSGSLGSSYGGSNRFECKVCGQWGMIPDDHGGRVAKCESCGEGTPIRNPAPGKQYVRCVCHCLLVCPIGVSYLRCPRKTCRRVVEVRLDTPAQIEVNERFAVTSTERQREEILRCSDCGKFYDRAYHEIQSLCPHCFKVHRNEERSARRGCCCFLILAVLCCIGIAVVLVFTRSYESTHHLMLVAWIGAGVLAVLFLVIGLRYAHKLHSVAWPRPVER